MRIIINAQTGERTTIPLSEEMLAQQATDNARWLSEKPMNEWKLAMKESDHLLSRVWEDHITSEHNGITGNAYLQAKYDAKIKLRSEKP